MLLLGLMDDCVFDFVNVLFGNLCDVVGLEFMMVGVMLCFNIVMLFVFGGVLFVVMFDGEVVLFW